MTATDLTPKLQAILSPKLRFLTPGAAVPMDEDLGKLGLDSMASIDLLMEIEQELGVQIPDDMMTADTFSTGNHLLAVIEKLVS
jgi:acyl carrier protein